MRKEQDGGMRKERDADEAETWQGLETSRNRGLKWVGDTHVKHLLWDEILDFGWNGTRTRQESDKNEKGNGIENLNGRVTLI